MDKVRQGMFGNSTMSANKHHLRGALIELTMQHVLRAFYKVPNSHFYDIHAS